MTKASDEKPVWRETAAKWRGKRPILASISARLLQVRLKHSGRVLRVPWEEVFDYLELRQAKLITGVSTKPSKRGRRKAG